MDSGTNSWIVRERLDMARKLMKENGVDVYVVCTGDYHLSEYVCDYFKEREFLSGFTGSAGSLVITEACAKLFTDGRYFVQADQQLCGTGIDLMRMNTAGVPDLTDYCVSAAPEGGVLGFDARTVSAAFGINLARKLKEKNVKIRCDFDAAAEIWTKRPDFPKSRAFEVEAGEERADKLARLRAAMREKQAAAHVIAALDDLCWLLNIRGRDVIGTPVMMCFGLITEEEVRLYADRERFDASLSARLAADGVKLFPYDAVYEDCAGLTGKVLADEKRINYALYSKLHNRENVRLVKAQNPTVLMKAVKNGTEIANLRAVHIEDGLAVTKFICRVKKAVEAGERVTEAEAAEWMDLERSKIEDFVEPSFDTICAYGENAAMMHYSAKKDACAVLEPHGMLLVDSGGQYARGTTDVTRTFALGPVSDEMRRHYTLTLRGMLALADAHFLSGCTGFNLDILARQFLWAEGIDYRCGTGHGVGYMLGVHEAPNGFRWRHVPGGNDLCVMMPGMVTSDEPGVYEEGKYGIRLENELVCVKERENEYGTFLKFDMLTCVPLDSALIDEKLLEKTDEERLNRYHEWVYNQLKDYLSGEELEFLKYETRRVGRL